MTRPTPTTSAAATTASEARDDDVEESGNGSHNRLQDRGYAVNDGHKAGANGLAERFDLFACQWTDWEEVRGKAGHTQDTMAPIVKVLRCAT